MRTAICIALVAMAISMSGCEWFTSAKKPTTAFDIQGNWIIDSLQGGIDSNTSTTLSALVKRNDLDSNNTGDHVYKFESDTMFVQLSSAETIANYYAFDSTKRQLIVKTDSIENKFAFTAFNDSSISLTSVDNSVLWLKRK